MSTIEQSVEVKVPVSTAYNQWTQFEEFPRFMEGVMSIRQIDDRRTHWHTNIGGSDKEFDAEITEQVPNQRIAWHSLTGPDHAGVVTFHHIDETTTRIMLQLDYAPEGLIEKAGDMLGLVSLRIKGDLDRFKEFIESQGHESGAWRGNVSRPS